MQTEIHDHWLVIVHVHALFQRHLSLFSFNVLRIPSRAGDSLIGFLSESLVFCKKNERMSDSIKKVSDWLIFGEQPERFAHGHSFLVSDLSNLLMVAHFWRAT